MAGAGTLESPRGEEAADTGHAGHQLHQAVGWASKPVLKPAPQPKPGTETDELTGAGTAGCLRAVPVPGELGR